MCKDPPASVSQELELKMQPPHLAAVNVLNHGAISPAPLFVCLLVGWLVYLYFMCIGVLPACMSRGGCQILELQIAVSCFGSAGN